MPALLVLLVFGAVLAMDAAISLAAAPAKGPTFAGELPGTQSRVSKRVVMKVAKDHRSATARLFCGGTSFGTLPRFKIENGKFSGVRKTGTLVVWRLSGRVVSRAKVRAKLSLPATCDGKGGRLTLLRKEA